MELKQNKSKLQALNDYEIFGNSNNYSGSFLSATEKLYNLCSLIVPSTFLSPFAACVMLITSFLQLLSITLSLLYYNEMKAENLFLILQYLRIYPAIEDLNSFNLYVFSYSATIIVMSILILSMVYHFGFQTSASFSYYIPVIYWIGMLPMLEMLISPFKCQNLQEKYSINCYDFYHFIFMAISILYLLIWVVLIFFITLASTYSQFYKHDPYAHLPWNFELLYTLFRVVILFENQFLEIYPIRLITVAFLFAYASNLIWHTYPYYYPIVSLGFNSGVGLFIVGCLEMLFKYWCNTFNLKIENDIKFILILSILLGIGFYWHAFKWYSKVIVNKSITSVYEMDTRLHILINAATQGITFCEIQDYFLQIHDHLEATEQNSDTITNILNNSLNLISNTDNSLVSNIRNPILVGNKNNRQILNNIISIYELDKVFYKESIPFLIQMAAAYLHIKTNPQFAYSTIHEIECLNPNFMLRFSIHMMKLEIIQFMSNSLLKNTKNTGKNNGYEQVIQFEAEYYNMREKMTEQTSLRLEFWSSLRNKPSLNKLHKLGLHMIILNNQIKSSFDKLLSIYKDHIGMLRIYKSYYNNIIGDKEEVTLLKHRIKSALNEKTTKDFGQIFAEHTTVLIISSDQKIVRASRNAEKIFSYPPEFLQGHSVTMLMPHLLATQHAKFINEFCTKGIVCGETIDTFGMERNGYLIPLKISKKQFYSLKLGMLYIAAIEGPNKFQNVEKCIITDNKGIVGGITRKIGKKLNISPTVFVDKKINIDTLCESPEGKAVLGFEGELILRFWKNSVDTKFAKAEREQYLAKCEVTSIKCLGGLTLWRIKILKKIESLDKANGKKKNKIDKSMINSVSVIMKAVRKFRILAVRANLIKNPKPIIFESSPLYPARLELSGRKPIFKKNESGNLLALQKIDKNQTRMLGELKTFGEEMRTEYNSKIKSVKSTFLQTLSTNDNEIIKGSLKKATDKLIFANRLMKKSSKKPVETRSAASGRAMREVSDIRKKDIKNFYPGIVKCLKYITQLFIIAVLMLLTIRTGVSISINSRIVGYAPLMHQNGLRVNYIGHIALLIQELSLLYPNFDAQPIMDTNFRQNRYDYTDVLKQQKINGTVNEYKDYVVKNLVHSTNMLFDAIQYTDRRAREFSPELREVISPSKVSLDYTINNNKFSSVMPLRASLSTLIATATQIISEIEEGTYTNNDNLWRFAVINSVANILRWLRASLDIIVTDAQSYIKEQVTFSLAILLSLIGIYVTYLLILVPFLWSTSRNLESMLMMLLDIARQDIRNERDKVSKFMRKLNRESKLKNNKMDTSNNNYANYENDSDQENSKNFESEDQHNESSDHEKIEGKKHEGRRRKQQYIPYESNVWKVLFLFSLLSGFAIGVYIILDNFTKQGTELTAYKVIELKFLSRNSYANAYNLPYLYYYIISNKTGICGTGPCPTYLNSYFTLRIWEINEMQRFHKGNESILDPTYKKLYNDIMEGDLCVTSKLKKLPNCTTFLGGIMRQGAFQAGVRYNSLSQSFFRDIDSTTLTIENMRKLINDPRLIDIEVLYMEYMDAATNEITNHILENLPKELNDSIIKTAILMSVFVIMFITTTLCWLVWLIGFMKSSIFDTKSLLSNLPDEVILKNKSIYYYLSNASSSIQTISNKDE